MKSLENLSEKTSVSLRSAQNIDMENYTTELGAKTSYILLVWLTLYSDTNHSARYFLILHHSYTFCYI